MIPAPLLGMMPSMLLGEFRKNEIRGLNCTNFVDNPGSTSSTGAEGAAAEAKHCLHCANFRAYSHCCIFSLALVARQLEPSIVITWIRRAPRS